MGREPGRSDHVPRTMHGFMCGFDKRIIAHAVHTSHKWYLSVGATVKAGTQEHRTEVMWFNTGNYTEMTQEVTINGSFPASYFVY